MGRFRPMLAATLEDPASLQFPVWCTPKLDGIRCITTLSGCVSRSITPIPNRFVQAQLKDLPPNLDGELIVPGAPFNEVSSAIMSRDGEPAFQYVVFDTFAHPETEYLYRIATLSAMASVLVNRYTRPLLPTRVDNVTELAALHERHLLERFEGTMIRNNGYYKYGRSTVREGLLLKYKPFIDSEAQIVGFEEMETNTNEQTRDHLGLAQRSHHKANLVPKDTLGAIEVEDIHTAVKFKIGTGFDKALRDEIWADQAAYLGRVVKYKYQPCGTKNKPRIPVFLGFRAPEDM